MRCVGCPLAFCEDCADWDGAMDIVPEQPPNLLQKVGFLKCNQAVYCYCTALCQQVSNETDAAILGKCSAVLSGAFICIYFLKTLSSYLLIFFYHVYPTVVLASHIT